LLLLRGRLLLEIGLSALTALLLLPVALVEVALRIARIELAFLAEPAAAIQTLVFVLHAEKLFHSRTWRKPRPWKRPPVRPRQGRGFGLFTRCVQGFDDP